MTDVSRILGERMKVELDESDREQPQTPKPAELATAEIIDRLHGVAASIASGDDPGPTLRLRHLNTIDLAIARLRKA